MRFGIPCFVLAACLLHPPALAAQSVTDRTPNLNGAWTGTAHSAYFNFMHRFQVSDDAARKVSNSPNFLMGYSVSDRVLLGANYATSSTVAPAYPNEWEFFARAGVLEHGDHGVVAAQAGYNLAASSFDAEISGAHDFGALRLVAGARAFTNGYYEDESRLAVAAGALFRLTNAIALAGDVATLLERADDEEIAWGAALQIAIPYTPHSLSLQAANTRTGTLQGSSRGGGDVAYGFEFTVPLTIGRYTGGSAGHAAEPPPEPATTAAPVVTPSPAAHPAEPTHAGAEASDPPAAKPAAQAVASSAAGDTVYADIKQLAFAPAELDAKVGTTVIWTNRDPLPHTVTAVDGSFDSGLIEPGKRWSYTFSKAGSFPFTCTPHPFMRGIVEVTR